QPQHISGGLLELQLIKECVRDIHAFIAQALYVALTLRDLVLPKSETTGVRIATEKVEVSLAHKKVGFFGWVPQQLAADLAVCKHAPTRVNVHEVQAGSQ